ncbi:hypothetical protein ACHAXR_010889 [Thalassiosira sp. AJA248-18]
MIHCRTGMMDGAYFTSRSDLLTFLNTLLNLNLTKIEQTASGAVACQLTEYIFPGSIPMSRVNWAAQSSYEYVDNYKLLQKAFTKHKIQRYVDVDKLIRGKYQDNLEFCQWLKAFFDQTAPMMRGGREGYDPLAVRAKGKGGKSVASGGGGGKKPVGAGSARAGGGASARSVGGGGRTGTTTASSRPTRSTATSSRPNSGSSSASSRVSASKENNANSRLPGQQRKVGASAVSSAKAAKYEEEIRAIKSENTTLKSKYSELERSTTEIEMQLQTVESERDFYFEKLRGIEVMLQVYKEKEDEEQGSGDVNKVMDGIFKVMYATMEDEVVVDDEGNLLGDITVESSIDKSALLGKAQDDLGDVEEDELLTSGIENTVEEEDEFLTPGIEKTVEDNTNELEDVSPTKQFSSDSDDDELLTFGLDDEEPVTQVDESVSKIDDSDFKECLVPDDDGFSDEDLLAED